MLLYLIRHAESQNNAKPAYSRVEDPSLTAVGRLQAQYLAEWIRVLEFDTLITSPVLRALQTARKIHDHTGQHVHVWDNVFEEGGVYRGFGPNAVQGGPGMARSQIFDQAASMPSLCTIDSSIRESGWWGRPREAPEEAWQRAVAVSKRLAIFARNQEQTIVLVTHADFKCKLLLTLLGECLSQDQVSSLSNTGVTKLTFARDAWRLDYLDSVSHLPPRLVTGTKV